MKLICLAAAVASTLIVQAPAGRAGDALKITILYDNTAAVPEAKADWGFACLVQGTEKTILFDTGTRSEIFSGNAAALKTDLERVGVIVISHAHNDHTGGLVPALTQVPGVPVYLPYSSPPALVGSVKKAGGADRSSKEPVDICKDAFLTGELGREIREQSLVLRTPKGLVVITGCSHPGIIPILERAKQAGGQGIYAVIGGFHLLQHPEPAVKEIIARFKELGVARVAATHCTGPRSIELFREAYGTGFIEAGAGRVIEIR